MKIKSYLLTALAFLAVIGAATVIHGCGTRTSSSVEVVGAVN